MQGQNFAKELSGPRLELTGKVISNFDCKPVKGAVLDVWQADANGNYDNKGYNLRGKIMTDKDGKYVLDTIYPGRLHTKNTDLRTSSSSSPIHIMVGVPGQPLLTTQIYFENQSKDTGIKNSLITRTVVNSNGTKIANFDFVIEDYRGLTPNTNIQGTNSTTRIPS
jgi:protocatechuate 3,4-dioxygenase beta subunit